MNLLEIFQQTRSHLSEDFEKPHQKPFTEDHLKNLAFRLETFFKEGLPEKPPAPYLPEEIVHPLDEAFSPFRGPLQKWEKNGEDPSVTEEFARAFEQAGCKNILLLLGQRITSASLQDSRAIPPTRKELIDSASREYKQGLTEVGRAWAKHATRSQDEFWGNPTGGPEDKNRDALAIVEKILNGVTWWNVFGHFQHERVYEARLPSGHGVRWTGDGKVFIGFLEPFDVKKGF